jgi:hypothetical protein
VPGFGERDVDGERVGMVGWDRYSSGRPIVGRMAPGAHPVPAVAGAARRAGARHRFGGCPSRWGLAAGPARASVW